MNKLALEFPGLENVDENLSLLDSKKTLTFREGLAGATPAEIINLILPLVFSLAGIILFVMLIAGGLTIFFSAGNPEKMKQGQTMITNAFIGLVIIFASYWIIQLIEFSLGLSIL